MAHGFAELGLSQFMCTWNGRLSDDLLLNGTQSQAQDKGEFLDQVGAIRCSLKLCDHALNDVIIDALQINLGWCARGARWYPAASLKSGRRRWRLLVRRRGAGRAIIVRSLDTLVALLRVGRLGTSDGAHVGGGGGRGR